jgi:hypothetical protein
MTARHGQAHPLTVGRSSTTARPIDNFINAHVRCTNETVLQRSRITCGYGCFLHGLRRSGFDIQVLLPMNIFFHTASPREIECEVHFTDGKVYNFKVSCQASKNNYHVVTGRPFDQIAKLLVKIDDYWYTEQITSYAGDINIKVDGREKYTQMLRDAAMKVKPSG